MLTPAVAVVAQLSVGLSRNVGVVNAFQQAMMVASVPVVVATPKGKSHPVAPVRV